jgi:hypothetical protein
MDNADPQVRTGQIESSLSQEEFAKRFRNQFFDPTFQPFTGGLVE